LCKGPRPHYTRRHARGDYTATRVLRTSYRQATIDGCKKANQLQKASIIVKPTDFSNQLTVTK